MEDVPADYLLWLYDQRPSHAGVAAYIEESYTALLKESRDYIPSRQPKDHAR